MALYRKKSIVIEAEQFTNKMKDRVFNWVNGNRYPEWDDSGNPVMKIEISKGKDLAANIDDWIIKGVNGKYCICEPDIFEATYEAVDELP